MQLHELRERVEQKQARLGVIGLGYVGLPVACMFADAGFQVVGVELRADRVEMINRGISPVDGNEPGLGELLMRVTASGKLHATTENEKLKQCDVVLICVETPVDEQNVPRYEALRSALNGLRAALKTGALVIVESTIAPGTMRDVVLPILQGAGKKLNQDFYLGTCPERVMPGKLLTNLRSLSRVVGGMTPATAETMVALYRHIVQAELDPTDCITAELVKTTENTYRDVQIAFANEVALICEAAGGDVWKVRELVNKSPGRNMLLPGAGVGGHCIPKDPWLLAHGVAGKNVTLRMIPSARAVNDTMPLHVADLIVSALRDAGKEIRGARVAVLGYAYLENSDDTRNSPSAALVQQLQDLGALVCVHDPYVAEYRVDVMQVVKDCDAVVVMVAHKEYKTLDLNALQRAVRTPILVDARRVFTRTQAQAAQMKFYGVGQAR